MVHSLELVFDDDTDATVIAEMNALADAGLRNPHRDQRPHVTLVAAPTISPAALTALAPAAQRLPITVLLGAPIVFSPDGADRGYVVARSVVPSAELLGIQSTVVRLAADHVDGAFDHSRPGGWSPHVTVARRLSVDRLGPALEILSTAADRPAVVTGIRLWDGEAKTETVLPGRAC
ncbi:2'-5' RNA ligase family protein [Gordonia sp. X0973]|uniref:2'-5' RNA ligase family protein n=1 Tax=Gordonia sp. X0973 TaxID=2742602 RepID=UPI000F527166|nr:2'-5' RNA ligase family protein [Gordonia sp. X0973]QKT07123.1 2'-5' RNA ligase family protein [Gordonia sp. X0973]